MRQLGAEIRHHRVDANQLQPAVHEPGRLPDRHAEQDLYGQVCLDRGVATLPPPASLAGRWRHQSHVRIEPDGQGATLRLGQPVLGLVARRDGSAHAGELPRWFRAIIP